MKWIWDGGFRVHKQLEDGTRAEKTFSSVAQARQFVEGFTGKALATKHKPPRNGRSSIRRKIRTGNMTPALQKDKEDMLKMFTVTDKVTGEKSLIK